MKWVVIVAVSCTSLGVTLTDVSVVASIGVSGSTAVYRGNPPSEPELTFRFADSREEAQEMATEPTLHGPDCAVSSWVLSPDGKAFRVSRVQRTRKVVREVEEPDGWDAKWDEVPR